MHADGMHDTDQGMRSAWSVARGFRCDQSPPGFLPAILAEQHSVTA